MGLTEISINKNIATITLNRGKVHALNESMVESIGESFESLKDNNKVRAVILTGQGSFFSFGFDVPELYDYSPEDFTRFLKKFTGLYAYIFLYPKPVIAALNGHTIAGGCMLAIACDYRLMVTGKARISLNEITFGSSVFAGAVAILKNCVGVRNADTILLSGEMYSAERAHGLGFIDESVTSDELHTRAFQIAMEYAEKVPVAFRSIKSLLRDPEVAELLRLEDESIREFVEIWYSDQLRENLKGIKIHS